MTLTQAGEGPDPRPDEVELIRQVQQNWNSGNQGPAVESIRPLADEGRPWAVALVAWLLMQQGYPAIEQSATYARKAAELGMPWVAVHVFNNMVGQVPNAPQLLGPLLELARTAAPWPTGIDPVGQGWNLVSQGQPEAAIRLMGMSWQFPKSPAEWDGLLTTARDRVKELNQIASTARQERDRVFEHAETARAAMDKKKDELETSAKQAGLLVSSTVSDATNALFKADAARNQDESKTAWRAGLTVLGAAAFVAVLPLVLHYLGLGPEYSNSALVGAHVASTAALATFAGVLLARARARDQAAQRANDLSTAMGTMISYSSQINEPAEKERFMMTMGQLVLQAHLTNGAGHGKDESLTGLVALMNLIRPNGAPTANA